MKKRYIVLAKDKKAVEAIDFDNATPDQVLELELSHEDYQFFFSSGLVDEINSACNTIIDDYEDEKIIGKSKIKAALSILEKYQFSFPNRTFFENLMHIFQEADSKDTAVFFFF